MPENVSSWAVVAVLLDFYLLSYHYLHPDFGS